MEVDLFFRFFAFGLAVLIGNELISYALNDVDLIAKKKSIVTALGLPIFGTIITYHLGESYSDGLIIAWSGMVLNWVYLSVQLVKKK